MIFTVAIGVISVFWMLVAIILLLVRIEKGVEVLERMADSLERHEDKEQGE